MKAMEERFGEPHPEMRDFKTVPPHLHWLQSAFFRLHRRRPSSDMGGIKPITYEQIMTFGERVMQLDEGLMPFFINAIEEIDDAVLNDHSAKG
jgi:hypothetical protein